MSPGLDVAGGHWPPAPPDASRARICSQRSRQASAGLVGRSIYLTVYDAELHAVQEATTALLTTTVPRSTAFICIDNQAAIDTLEFNKDNHEYARCILECIGQLRLLGWIVSTVWCPSHCGIMGNKRADTLAKIGTSPPVPCRDALTTKVWLQTQARAQLLQRWKQELPLSNPSFTFPTHLHGVDWADTP